MSSNSLRFLVVVALVAASCAKTPPPAGPTRPPGLYATPEQIAFTCVTPGCDETKVVRVTVSGSRRVAVKRLVLTGAAVGDFSFTPSEAPPFIVGPGASFSIDVRYSPSGAPVPGAVTVSVTYTDASPEESPDRLPPGELPIPLVRRLVGEPELLVAPETLRFGVVPTGQTKSLELQVKNAGFGNVALDVEPLDAGSTGVKVAWPAVQALIPDAGFSVPMTWAPTTPKYLHEVLEVAVSTPGVPSGHVLVEGTSLYYPRIDVEPAHDIDFGEVPKATARRVPIDLVNQGGSDLVVTQLELSDTTGNVRLFGLDGGAYPLDGGATVTVPPLGRETLVIELNGATPGDVDAELGIVSNDSTATLTTVSLRGTVTEPKITVTPATIDFGTVPQGWVVTKPIELRNTGYGSLTVKNITFVAGSSMLYSLTNLPTLPFALKRDQRVAFEVQLRAETAATFAASVSIESDDAALSFAEVPVTARIGTCAEGCPIVHGMPTCNGNVCAIGSCDATWFDTDSSASNGCECHDVSADPGAFCSDSTDLGELKDNDHVQRSFTGLLPTADDVDVIRFFGKDSSAIFDENFNVKVRLESADPAISFCIYRHETGDHQSDCFFDNEVCPQNRYYEIDGTLVVEDGADFIVKVKRLASSPQATCTPYTVYASNGL